MGTPKAQNYEHAEIRVNDLGQALDFYKGVMGLVEIAREDGVTYLGCGSDENYDLAVREGGTGLEHFAIRVDSEESLERYAARLSKQGVKGSQQDDAEPGQERGLRFDLPGGPTMELVLVRDNRYLEPHRPAYPRRSGFGPLDSDHINLSVTDPRRTISFLHEVLDFKISDVTEPEPGFWPAAWMRWGNYHHDVGVFLTDNPAETLHHVAFAMSGIEHMKMAADMMADAGVRLELGPGRHPIGPNLFIYFLEPGGNRFELSAEGAVVDPRTPTRYWTGLHETLDAWGDAHNRLPDTFMKGS